MKKKYISITIILVALIVLATIFYNYYGELTNKDTVREFIKSKGSMAPLVLIFLQLFQTVVPFMPGGIITLAAGYLFGIILGTIYSTIGLVIGSIIVFEISQRFGKPLLERVVDKKLLKNINTLSKKNGPMLLFITRIMPFFPHDLISYAVGSTNLSRKKFVLATTFGFLIHSFIHNYVGDSIYQNQYTLWFYAMIFLMVISLILYFFKKKIFNKLSK